jgi:heterodisulfide reductase subunit A
MLPHFQTACEQAGLDGNEVELVDIREGCAWVHQETPHEATNKAIDLIRMGIARSALINKYQPVAHEVVHSALVIGGGVAGLTSALTLAETGVPVKLVEREAELGGMLRSIHTLYPDRRSASQYLTEIIEAVSHHPHIDVLLETKVKGVSGRSGHYTINVTSSSQQQDDYLTFDVGAIIVATGACAIQPHNLPQLDGKRLVTQIGFEDVLKNANNDAQESRLPTNVVMLLNVDQRDQSSPHFSDVCWMAAFKQATEVREANPEANVTILFHNLYLSGGDTIQEQLLQARQAGVNFIRFDPSSPPKITEEVIEVTNQQIGNATRLSYDCLVLATPLAPQPDAGVIAHMLHLVQDENGFFPEVRYRLHPKDISDRGIYVCGAAHYPVGWNEAEFQATRAAFNALRFLRAGSVESKAPTASVNEQLCSGCGNCIDLCPFNAISMQKRQGMLDLSQIDPLLCKGCGNCVVGCPVKAINLPINSDVQLVAQIEEALATVSQEDHCRILTFGCEWSCRAAADLAGVEHLNYPVDVRPINVRCSARIDPMHVLWAFIKGADGVFMGACPPGDCHYINGNRYAHDRFDSLRTLMIRSAFDPRRLRMEWITPDDPYEYVNKITEFTNLVRALGPSYT